MRAINKRGQVLNATTGIVLGLMTLIFLVFAVLYGVATLNPGSFFSAGLDKNAVVALQQNTSEGIGTFAGQIPTVFKVLAVVLALSAIVILVLYVRRMYAGSGGGAGGI